MNSIDAHALPDSLIRAGLALARSNSREQVYADVAREIEQRISSHGIVIALLDEESHHFEVVLQHGFAADNARHALEIDDRLVTSWRSAIAQKQVVVNVAARATEITIPLVDNERTLGAITVATLQSGSASALAAVEQQLSVLVAHASVAIERARLAELAMRNQRLESVGEVAAGVAHELRNPLFGISSAAQLLLFRFKDDQTVEKNVGRILREVGRLNRMVTSLLEYGRPDPLTLSSINPDDIWDAIVESERERLEPRQLTLERARVSPPVTCAVDAEQISHVFRNVITNAIEASDDGATISIHSHRAANGAWRCRVHNAGPIIPADVLPHVFDFFYSTKPGGGGIGLALSQRIVHDHGGTITIDSTPANGTTLSIMLPPVSAS